MNDTLFTFARQKKEVFISNKNISYWKKLKYYPLASSVVLFIIIAGCLFANIIMNHDPTQFYLNHLNEAPDRQFYFGTDSLGRDIFSIIWSGGRVSLSIGFLSMIVSAVIGIVYGCISGIAPYWMDNILMRLAELISSIPNILLILLLLSFMGTPNIFTIAFVIGITGWLNLARIVRSEVRQTRNSDYVFAARCMGAGFFHILKYHLLPNFLSPIMFMLVSSIGTGILMESTLSFLGLGLPIDIVSWGSMLSLSNRALLTNSWWIILIPGVFIIITLFCITNIGLFFRHKTNQYYSNL